MSEERDLGTLRSDRRKVLAGELKTIRSTADQTDIDITVGVDQLDREVRPTGIPSGEETGRVKLTVNLPERDMATLRSIAARRDISLTDAVRRAIAMEQFIEEVESQGGKLLVEQPDHSMRQLVLR